MCVFVLKWLYMLTDQHYSVFMSWIKRYQTSWLYSWLNHHVVNTTDIIKHALHVLYHDTKTFCVSVIKEQMKSLGGRSSLTVNTLVFTAWAKSKNQTSKIRFCPNTQERVSETVWQWPTILGSAGDTLYRLSCRQTTAHRLQATTYAVIT